MQNSRNNVYFFYEDNRKRVKQMQFEPMIKARINSFKTNHALSNVKEDRLFELFVNDVILRSHQPDISVTEDSLLDECSVGGADDMGIDGIAIKVNGIFVSTEQDIDELVELNKQLSIEFIFVQSKNKDKIDSGEFGKFADGVTDFLSEEHLEPRNEKIDALLQIKDYLFSDKIILRWKSNPAVRVYYVIFGQWRDSKHIKAKSEKLSNDIAELQSYEAVHFSFVDNTALKRMCEENEHSFSTVLNAIDNFGLTEVAGVENSLIALLYASELIKLITTEDNRLRQSLFTDNVRDYQGETEINAEILNTIRQVPTNFALLNNGITIVCSDVVVSNRKLTLANPQIVNGCQTCNVLFEAHSSGVDISKVTLLAKVIATEKDELTTSVIRGTNSQNVVYNEAFETTRDFHKHLEEFFDAVQQQNDPNKIYYERRSRQYSRETGIAPGKIIGLKALTQSFVSIFLCSPHLGTSHEAILLKKYKNSIFVDGQSFKPYYVAARMCLRFEELRRDGVIDRNTEQFKHHVLYIASEQIAGVCPSINDSLKIDAYCDKLLHVLSDQNEYVKAINKANETLKTVIKKWVKKFGSKYRHAIKDNQNFTSFLATTIRGGNTDSIEYDSVTTVEYRGRVIKCRKDRNGFYYGFIHRPPNDVFFHERDNNQLDLNEIYGKTVLYRVFTDTFNGEDRAVIIEVLEED